MNPEDAATILALRPAIENLVIRASENPASFFPLSEKDEKLVEMVKSLCRFSSIASSEDQTDDPKSWGHTQQQQYEQYRNNDFVPNNVEGGFEEGYQDDDDDDDEDEAVDEVHAAKRVVEGEDGAAGGPSQPKRQFRELISFVYLPVSVFICSKFTAI